MTRTIREFENAYPAERIADRASRMGLVSFDEECNGGRIAVIGRHAVYICTDAHAIGNISTFETAEEARAWAEETLAFFADAE